MRGAIAIGASAGGVEALRGLVARLPRDLPLPLLVVLHIGPHRSYLPEILAKSGPLPAKHAEPGEELQPGTVYLAPSDCHFLVEDRRAALRRGPKENWARPAIDPLFRSAAAEYGGNLLAVVLSGHLNDGTAGLHEVKRRGGLTAVQDPAEAVEPSMPRSALEHVDVDHIVKLSALPGLVVDFAASHERAEEPRPAAVADGRVDIGEGEMIGQANPWRSPTAHSCPACGGAMRQENAGSLMRYTCHIGHAFTAQTLASAQIEAIERAFETAFRSLKERAELCDRLAADADRQKTASAASWREAAQEARERARLVEDLVRMPWSRPTEA